MFDFFIICIPNTRGLSDYENPVVGSLTSFLYLCVLVSFSPHCDITLTSHTQLRIFLIESLWVVVVRLLLPSQIRLFSCPRGTGFTPYFEPLDRQYAIILIFGSGASSDVPQSPLRGGPPAAGHDPGHPPHRRQLLPLDVAQAPRRAGAGDENEGTQPSVQSPLTGFLVSRIGGYLKCIPSRKVTVFFSLVLFGFDGCKVKISKGFIGRWFMV